MNTFRRAFFAVAMAAALAGSTGAVAQAAFPTKPVKIIVGFPAGGPLDAHARLLADKLGQQLGQTVVDRLAAAFKATLETPEIRTRMVAQGADPAFLGPEGFGKYLQAEMPKWAKAVKDSGAKLD